MNRAQQLIRTIRDDEHGYSLPEVMVSVIVNLLAIGIIAASIVSFTIVEHGFAVTAAASSQSTLVEAQWRKTINAAQKIDPKGLTGVILSSARANGLCQTVTWEGTQQGSQTELRTVTVLFGSPPAADGTCTGEPTGSSSITLIPVLASDSLSFGFANSSGRAITYGGTSPALDNGATKPVGVSDSVWGSIVIARATITATVQATETKQRQFAVEQVATKLLAPKVADAPTEMVTP